MCCSLTIRLDLHCCRFGGDCGAGESMLRGRAECPRGDGCGGLGWRNWRRRIQYLVTSIILHIFSFSIVPRSDTEALIFQQVTLTWEEGENI